MTDIPWEQLFEAALAVRAKAYARYSHFTVGAALLLEGGEIISGCNVENASYGLALCAERNAIGQLVARHGKRDVLACAVVADSAQPCSPCGMCRQVLAEFSAPDLSLPVRSRTLTGQEDRYTIGELLPHAFTGGLLPKKP
jgi:cytidine deaminase